MDFNSFLVSLKLSVVVTVTLMLVTLPVAYCVAFSRTKFKTVIETALTLPLVMPPTVLGFYLLILFSRNSVVGRFFDHTLGLPLVFSFAGIAAASFIYSFPFAFQPLKAGFESFDHSLIEASYTLGKSRFATFVRVILPGIRPSFITAISMCFAHTMGEFGAVLMIGGNIPGVTRVASIAVYDKVEQLDFVSAHIYSFILLAIGFCILLTVNYVNQKRPSP
jgi:molybdate transport system permease protein